MFELIKAELADPYQISITKPLTKWRSLTINLLGFVEFETTEFELIYALNCSPKYTSRTF